MQTIIIETKKEIYMKKDSKSKTRMKNCSAKAKSDCKCPKTKDCNQGFIKIKYFPKGH